MFSVYFPIGSNPGSHVVPKLCGVHTTYGVTRPSASQWHDATLGAVALMARSGVSVLLKRRTALQLDTLTGLLSQQSEPPTTAEMNAKLAVGSGNIFYHIFD